MRLHARKKMPGKPRSLHESASDTDMSAPEPDPRLANEIARIRKRARDKDALSGRMLLGWLIAGPVAGLAAWFIQDPMDREGGIAFATGGLVFIVGWFVSEAVFSDNFSPKCPKCGYAWDEEGKTWPSWICCPGCGLRMNDESTQP